MKKVLFLILSLLVVAAAAFAGRLTHVTEKAESAATNGMDVDLSLSVGKFNLMKERLPNGTLAEMTGDYNEDKYEYSYTFDDRSKIGDFVFESKTLDKKGSVNHIGDENRWDFAFAPEADCQFKIEIGAAEANLDFGDLTVSDLSLEIGAADAEVDFSSPNRSTIREFSVDAGACDLEMKNLGNSRFEHMKFDGGMGSFELDFTGDFDFEADAEISVGMGSIEIVIPEDVGVRLQADENWFNSIDFPKRSFHKVRGEDMWESDNYDSAKGKLNLTLDIGMGSADIRVR